jgi:hypothetical protein
MEAEDEATPSSCSPAMRNTEVHTLRASHVESISKVTRQLKREQNSLFNCLNSIVHDRGFVEEIRALYPPSMPMLANLRCGLWYTAPTDGTCYFKSTDGHHSNWSFSKFFFAWGLH